jgi:hypothetical protein
MTAIFVTGATAIFDDAGIRLDGDLRRCRHPARRRSSSMQA